MVVDTFSIGDKVVLCNGMFGVIVAEDNLCYRVESDEANDRGRDIGYVPLYNIKHRK